MHSPSETIVIVGGGPAGLTAGITLVRNAPTFTHKVVVLEREHYPREKICAGAIGRRGDRIHEQLGVRVDVPGVTIDGISIQTSQGCASSNHSRIGRVIRRSEYDAELAAQARAIGVRIEEGITVESVHGDDRSAILETSGGPLRAKVVVGADGVGSRVRKSLGLGIGQLRAQVLEVDTEPALADRPRNLLHVDISDARFTGYTWDFPTLVDGQARVCRGVYQLRLGNDTHIEGHLRRRLSRMGLDIRAARHKRFAERGWEPTSTLARGRLMLIGEAAGIDPLTGEGIPQAIEYGALAGSFLAQTQDGRPVEDWQRVVSGSRLARDLRIRRFIMRQFFVRQPFGGSRAALESLVVDCPRLLAVGSRHFAGRPHGKLDLAHLVAHAAWRFTARGLCRR